MTLISICKKECPWFSLGMRSELGITGGFGCTKYSVAMMCIASEVKGVTADQYQLTYDDQKGNENQRLLMSAAVEMQGVPSKWEQESIDRAKESHRSRSV